jgi:hypothetical protein
MNHIVSYSLSDLHETAEIVARDWSCATCFPVEDLPVHRLQNWSVIVGAKTELHVFFECREGHVTKCIYRLGAKPAVRRRTRKWSM